MIRCFASSKSVCTITKKGDLPKLKGKDDFACLFLEKPTEEEINKVCKEYKFNKKHFLDYNKEERSMRYSMSPLVFVFIDYYIEGNDIRITHTLFAMEKNVLVVVAPHKSKFYTQLFESLASRLREEGRKKNQLGYFLYYFLYEDARENYDVLDKLEDDIQDIEQNIRKPSMNTKLIDDIVKLKRKCFRMSKQLWASAKVIFTIKRGLTPLILGKDLLILMDDVYDTLLHQIDLSTVQREILTDLLEIYASIINNKLAVISNDLNKIMKKLTAFTLILMIPTFITGFYGMNFKYMPELASPYGYIAVTVIMIIVTVVQYFYFHKKGWI